MAEGGSGNTSGRPKLAGTDASAFNAIAGGNAQGTANSLIAKASAFAAGGGTRASAAAAGSTGTLGTTSSGGLSYGNTATPGFASGQLKFPSDIGSGAQSNHMMFTIKEITGGNADARSIQFKTMTGAPVICLPIPSGLNTSNQQAWGRADVSAANAHLISRSRGASDYVAEIANLMRQSGKNASEITGTQQFNPQSPIARQTLDQGAGTERLEGWGEVWNRIKKSMDREIGGLATEFPAMVAASPLKEFAEAAQYKAGLRAVNQAIMSYSGPGFRNFTYNFSLKPFSIGESKVAHRIVDSFKIYSAPDQIKGTELTRVYNLPAVFKIQFFYGAEEHREIGHIGHCALTNISVTYGGSKFSTFAGSHSPTQIDISLSFQELELLNREMLNLEEFGGIHWPGGDGGGGGAIAANKGDAYRQAATTAAVQDF